MNHPSETATERTALQIATSESAESKHTSTEPKNVKDVEDMDQLARDSWSSTTGIFCEVTKSLRLFDPVSLLFGDTAEDDDRDDALPGQTLLVDDSQPLSSSSPEDTAHASTVKDTAEEQPLSPTYQKRGRFLVWPASISDPLSLST